MSKKQMGSYFNLDSTAELIKEICIVDGLRIDEVKKASRGKEGGTWVHPIVFIDMAMWYSPELKVRILKWVQDGLLMARDSSGESFKTMSSTLSRVFPNEMSNPLRYREVANLIAMECKVGSDKDRWEKATEDQLKQRDRIQNNITLIADLCSNVGTCVSKAIEKSKQLEG
jgi:hypothetical protein